MSRVLSIARADARRAIRHRLVWGAILLLALLFLPSIGSSANPDIHPLAEFLLLGSLDLMTFALVVVAAVGYGSVVSERVTGTVRFVLGLPATRRDLVFGKLLSRAGVASLALVVILAITTIFVVSGYGSSSLLPFWVMSGWMLCYVLVWSAVTVGYSAAFDSPYRTLGALVVTYVCLSFNFGVWSVVIRPLFALVFTGSTSTPSYEHLATAPVWLRVTERLNPLVDFWHAVRWSIDVVGPGTPAGGPLPHLLGMLVFFSFGAIPLLVGTRRFERAELGENQAESRFVTRLKRSIRRAGEALPERAFSVTSLHPSVPIQRLALVDVRHALQNWTVTGALIITILLVGPELWSGVEASGIHGLPEELSDIATSFALPTLVLGIAVGHDAVVGERRAGTVRLVLGLPVKRGSLVVGKLLSRVALVMATLLPLLVFAAVLVEVRLGQLYPLAVVAWGGWVLLFAGFWTTVCVGVSAAVSTRYRSLAVIFATYLFFSRGVGLWDPVVRPVFVFVFTGGLAVRDYSQAATPPAWFQYLDHLNPFIALETVQEGLFELVGFGSEFTDFALPLFLYSLAVVFLYGILGAAVGARRFERCDLY